MKKEQDQRKGIRADYSVASENITFLQKEFNILNASKYSSAV